MQKSSCTPNIVKNSLEMLIYFHGNCAFSLVFSSLWDKIRLLHLPSDKRKSSARSGIFVCEAQVIRSRTIPQKTTARHRFDNS
ncbi:MAG: hypothetical protein BECKG1743D_GA0114223_107542 [Candidatus Kentron sp. G]|nr:MAG: hypothetical protein BECKG1743F_GA0114225_108082 [Candidatus Kentron sp. G]VFN05683.1 MAG: hypothetical protein BECKG1743D_GA0114223_107542 [Candidatus Kentron sp. G]